MELQMDTVMAVSVPPDAFAAVASLLLSLGINNAAEALPLATALATVAEGAVEEPRRRAMRRIGEWFARHLGQPELDPEQAFLIGRAAFVAADAAKRWPGVLLADAPPEFVEALVAQAPRLSPALPALPMVAQPLEAPSLLAPVAAAIRGVLPGGARTA
jgi:hypothetical protein